MDDAKTPAGAAAEPAPLENSTPTIAEAAAVAPVAAAAPSAAPEPAASVSAEAGGSAAAPAITIDPSLQDASPAPGWMAAMADRLGRLADKRTAALAASVVVAVGVGVGVGAVATPHFTGSATKPAPEVKLATSNDLRALSTAVSQLKADLAALRSSAEAATRNANANFAKLTDRMEKAQAEPLARIAKLSDSLERLEKRVADPGPETTGSIAPAATAPAAVPQPRPAVTAVVPGWRVRSVYDGIALIQGRMGLIEVAPGDEIPGIGRVEAIRRQEGRWVVVTSRGLIASIR